MEAEATNACITEARARVLAKCCNLRAEPYLLKLLIGAPDEDAAWEICRQEVVNRRISDGESYETLIDQGYVTEADLDESEDDMREIADAVDAETGVRESDSAALRFLRTLPALRERLRNVNRRRDAQKAEIELGIEARRREREEKLARERIDTLVAALTPEQRNSFLKRTAGMSAVEMVEFEECERSREFWRGLGVDVDLDPRELEARVAANAAKPERTLEESAAHHYRLIAALAAEAAASGYELSPIDRFLARLTVDQLAVFMRKSVKPVPGEIDTCVSDREELDAFLVAAEKLSNEQLASFMWTCRRTTAQEVDEFLEAPSAQRSQAETPPDVLDEIATNTPSYPWDQVISQATDAEALAQVMHQPTEDNVALLFERECHARFRYCKEWGCWLVWDGARWRVERTDAALDFSRALARRVNTQGKSSIAKASFARGVEALARAARCFSTVPEEWDFDEFSLNTPVGIVDLRTGSMRSHSTKEYVTRITRVAPQPGPRRVFDRFMREITLGDEALINYHQRSLGAILSGARADHWLLFWIGTGRNGKNTLGELVEWIFGDYARTIPTETLMSAQTERHPTELANLRALRLAISSEVPEGAHWNESRIKSLTGDATISARYMRQDFFTFPRGHKHLVYGNHRPQLRVVDDAIRARMHVVPFRAIFSDELGNRDPHLPEKLRAEAPTILAWLIDGHLQWVADGYTLRKCEAVKRETADYFETQSTPDLWLLECCELVPNDDRPTGSLEKASVLYRSYSTWKEARGEHPMGQVRWGEWMGSRFVKVRADGVRYRGIRLKAERATEPYWNR